MKKREQFEANKQNSETVNSEAVNQTLFAYSPIRLRKSVAFTLAEVLITMAVIGVVAAVTVPALVINIQERVQNEQARSAKYKLTKATDKMKSLGLLDTRYNAENSTELFVNELKKHLKIMKTCDGTNTPLSECWPNSTISLATDSSATSSFNSSPNVNDLTTGEKLKALALGTKNTKTMGIVTADGTPMILVYSPKCDPLDVARTYTWSTVDNKPETNATTNCISAIMDVNGKKGPNRLGKDVRTLNSLYGALEFASGNYGGASYTSSDCNNDKNKLGIQYCGSNPDYWAAAVKKCHEHGLHLPSEQTLAVLAGLKYGKTDVTYRAVIALQPYVMTLSWSGTTCEEKIKSHYGDLAQPICLTESDNSAPISLSGYYYSNGENNGNVVRYRDFGSSVNNFSTAYRNNNAFKALCVGD